MQPSHLSGASHKSNFLKPVFWRSTEKRGLAECWQSQWEGGLHQSLQQDYEQHSHLWEKKFKCEADIYSKIFLNKEQGKTRQLLQSTEFVCRAVFYIMWFMVLWYNIVRLYAHMTSHSHSLCSFSSD